MGRVLRSYALEPSRGVVRLLHMCCPSSTMVLGDAGRLTSCHAPHVVVVVVVVLLRGPVFFFFVWSLPFLASFSPDNKTSLTDKQTPNTYASSTLLPSIGNPKEHRAACLLAFSNNPSSLSPKSRNRRY
jgi:hypothetical protein